MALHPPCVLLQASGTQEKGKAGMKIRGHTVDGIVFLPIAARPSGSPAWGLSAAVALAMICCAMLALRFYLYVCVCVYIHICVFLLTPRRQTIYRMENMDMANFNQAYGYSHWVENFNSSLEPIVVSTAHSTLVCLRPAAGT